MKTLTIIYYTESGAETGRQLVRLNTDTFKADPETTAHSIAGGRIYKFHYN